MRMAPKNTSFTFEISLSVLNHLGRHLYRSFGTVLGEAISNAWDADARNVRLYIDRENNSFIIKDDGDGMSAHDFQNKFLKIGYSKRKGGVTRSKKKRPFIGRKGIGKLALLSSAARITVISKQKGASYVGGVIDNTGLDRAITNDLTPDQYPLGTPVMKLLDRYTAGHKHGTIVYFENIKTGIKSSFEFLKKLIALYFRFSLIDKSFRIFLDDEEITHEDLKSLAERTQFLWTVGQHKDPFVTDLKRLFNKAKSEHETKRVLVKGTKGVHGFVASVIKPRDLKIMTTDERIGVDLFVNGRLRERDILKRIPTATVVENYLYGQIHYDRLDDATDRFTSSREGVVADDPKYSKFLDDLRKTILKIVEDWDKWRIAHREEGDSENQRISNKTRASLGLFNAISDEYGSPKDAKAKKIVDQWFKDLQNDAAFNFESYGECFVSENLVRKYIQQKKVPLTTEATNAAKKWRQAETDSKGRGNISIDIRRVSSDLNYLAMDDLANLVDKPKDPQKDAGLGRDAREYKPIRDAVAHTALLTDSAKTKLGTVRENIKGRVKTLLSASK